MILMNVSGWRVSPHHFSERHGLIFIIALGEAVISIGIGASRLVIDSKVVIPAMIGLGVIVAMWWTYFDVAALAAERHLKTMSGVARIRLAQHAYSYAHLPMIIGAIFFSLGVKKTLAHTDEVLSMIPAVALCHGLCYSEGLQLCGLASRIFAKEHEVPCVCDQNEPVLAPVLADLLASHRQPGIIIGRLDLQHPTLRNLTLARFALLDLLRCI